MGEPEEEDFAALFEASLQTRQLEKGELVDGTVVSIGPEAALVDVGGKGEAVINVDELRNADGEIEVAVGDRIQAMVVSTVRGVTLSRKLVAAAASEAAAAPPTTTRRDAGGLSEIIRGLRGQVGAGPLRHRSAAP